MKKATIFILIIVFVIAGAYFFLIFNKTGPNGKENENISTYRNMGLGFEFQYKTGPEGYALEVRTPAESETVLLNTIILMRTEDAEWEVPVGGEGPPTITMQILKNARKQDTAVWALNNTSYSNINLKMSDQIEAVVGEANAIRYKADGLYTSDNVIVAHGENVYVISGMYLDEDSAIRKDFQSLLATIKFISVQGQE